MGELKAAMTQAEFESWQEFYAMSPFDDLHRYHRPAALIATSMAGGDVSDRIEWLHPSGNDLSEADMKTLKAFGLRK